jgi:hypothetical protein
VFGHLFALIPGEGAAERPVDHRPGEGHTSSIRRDDPARRRRLAGR